MTDTNTPAPQNTQEQLASAISSEVMIELDKVNKWYGNFHVLKDIDLTVHKGERIVVCGPSGSGKSTLIRCINHLEEHQAGTIIVDGITLDKNLKHIDHIRTEVPTTPGPQAACRTRGDSEVPRTVLRLASIYASPVPPCLGVSGPR